MRITAFARTDVGRVRPENEDDYFVGETVFAVADGMGGHAGGEVAAKTALEPLVAIDGRSFDSPELAQEALVEALRDANRQVVEKAEAEPELQGMGTTLTAGLLRDGRLHLAHVGDSRAYLLREGDAIMQLTTDHTLVERLIRDGRLSRAEAATHPQRNVVTRAIGNEPDVVVDSLPPLWLQPGDQIMLCSDGLSGPLEDTEIAAVLTTKEDGDAAVAKLVDQANDAGGPDNITVVLLRVEAEEGDPPVAAPPEEPNVRRIRTRQDSQGGDWARRLGQLGAQQGATQASVKQKTKKKSRDGGGKGKRVLAGLLALVLLLAVVAGGSVLLLSRAFFIGEHEGQVAIYQGIPHEVWEVPLHRVMEDEITELEVSEFPGWRQDAIREGIEASTVGEARNIIRGLAQSIDEDLEDQADSDADSDSSTDGDADTGTDDGDDGGT